MAELWRRPWALVDLAKRHRLMLADAAVEIAPDHRASVWLYSPGGEMLLVDGRKDTTEAVAGFTLKDSSRTLSLVPQPLRVKPGVVVTAAKISARITWPDAPERPPAKLEPQTQRERDAHTLMLRAQAVLDRLHDVDSALADPSTLWEELRRRWIQEDQNIQPQMHVIVRHALRLSRTLDELERSPRHVLRRTHQQIPISRVQELDRRAMAWLVRQPGETLAERAGDRQRVLAVARQENFDTLENRVLRAYAELARHVAKDYLERNAKKSATTRARKVEEFGKRCRRISLTLAERGVRLAEPGVTPNFVLQQNANYHAIWTAWQDLLRHNTELDEIWRWQARSWDEFCAIAVIVAMVGIPGSKLISAAPLTFRDEQYRGSWIDHDNPLAAFHLPEHGIVVEIRYRMANPNAYLADFGAPIWIRIGKTGDTAGFLANIAVWPMWDVRGGLAPEEAEELEAALQLGANAQIVSGIVLRPSSSNEFADVEQTPKLLMATIGTDGAPLWQGLDALTHFLTTRLTKERRP